MPVFICLADDRNPPAVCINRMQLDPDFATPWILENSICIHLCVTSRSIRFYAHVLARTDPCLQAAIGEATAARSYLMRHIPYEDNNHSSW